MIPKIIHYCWLSDNPIPKDMERYMSSWKKVLPDYEWVLWNFNRFDINSSIWVKEAFDNKKYAFAADYIRLYALYTMGGIYLDMDVEVLKSYDDLLDMDYFACYENGEENVPEMATLGAEKGCWWIKLILDYYKDRNFIKSDGTMDMKPLPQVVRDVLKENNVSIVPQDRSCIIRNDKILGLLDFDFFSPKSYSTSELSVTFNTYSIHQFTSSWFPWEQKMERKLWLMLGLKPRRVMWHVDKWIEKIFRVSR